MKKMSFAMAMVFVLVCVLAGCGGSTSSSTAAPASTAAPSSTAAASSEAAVEIEEITLKFAHHYADGSVFGQISNNFAETVAEKSGGAITVEVFSDSVLGTEEQAIQQLQAGTIDITLTGTMLQTSVPMLGIVQGPFLFKDWKHAKEVMQGELGEEIYAQFEEGGLKAICTFGEGFRHFVLVNPIHSMDDFQGYRMRMASYKNMLALATALGCATTNSPMGEVFTSLQTGVYDGCDAVYSAITAYSWQEPANYVLESKHAFSSSAICIATLTWEKLSDAQKDAIMEASKIVSDDAWSTGEEVEAEEKQKVLDTGIDEIIVPSEAFMDEMKAATMSVWEDMFAEVPGMEDLYNRIKALE